MIEYINPRDVYTYLDDFSSLVSSRDENPSLNRENGCFFPNKIGDISLKNSKDFNFTEKIILAEMFTLGLSSSAKYGFIKSNHQLADDWGISISSVAHAVSNLEKREYINAYKVKLPEFTQPKRVLMFNSKKFDVDDYKDDSLPF